ncbi:hypothetical protein [Pelagibius sp.]|uniref:hypothetical protein n=1 Tax=Pelagibius sp. TaxID=1931238 RepID=UPI00263578EB|nr:hypothetical protein [Pelagibius sp.]
MSPPSIVRRPHLLIAAAALSAFLPAAALADSQEATVTDLQTQKIAVASNGTSYTQMVPQTSLAADVRVQADAGVWGRVEDWSVYLILQHESGTRIHLSDAGFSKDYPWNELPKSVDRTVTLSVPANLYEHFVVARCNKLADDLRADDVSDDTIFGQDRSLELAVRPSLKVNFLGPDTIIGPLEQADGWGDWEKVEVVCKKWSGPAIPQAASGLTYEPAQLVDHGLSLVEVSTVNGACKIRLDGWITANQKNAKISFRYKSLDGQVSQIHEVNSGESKTATFSHWYDVPNNPGGGEYGHVWMEGVSHDFQSAFAGYSLNCVEGGPDGLVSNDPPKLSFAVVPQGQVMVHGRICPAVVKLVGVLTGQGNFSGQALFYGPGYLSPLRDYSVTHGQKVIVGAEAALDWDDLPAPPAAAPLAQAREFAFNVTNENNVVIASLPKKTVFLECKLPMVTPGLQVDSDLTLAPGNSAAVVRGTTGLKAPSAVAPLQILKAPAASKMPQSLRRTLIEGRRLKRPGT